MNKRDKSIEDLVGRMRGLLSEQNDDLIEHMREATDEMLGPAEGHECQLENYANLYSSAEEHECWLEGYTGYKGITYTCMGCTSTKSEKQTFGERDAMYNAMRHLDADYLLGLEDALDGLYTGRPVPIPDLGPLRAAAKALRQANK